MKKQLTVAILWVFFCCSCKNGDKDKNRVRIVFDAEGLEFISMSLNPTTQTTSALYGNMDAFESLSNQDEIPKVGSVLKLVTWKYHDNPQYTGSTINGELLKVETAMVDPNGVISYSIKSVTENRTMEAGQNNERIKYFMSFKPVSRP